MVEHNKHLAQYRQINKVIKKTKNDGNKTPSFFVVKTTRVLLQKILIFKNKEKIYKRNRKIQFLKTKTRANARTKKCNF